MRRTTLRARPAAVAKPAAGDSVPEPAARNIEAIAALERQALHERSRLDHFTDAVTAAVGNPIFVVAHAAWFGAWIALNLTRDRPFDPYPFNLLMLVVALEAIFLSAAVLMTQNRMQRQADKRAHLDLQVNLLAEQELTAMLKMLRSIAQRLDVPVEAHEAAVEQLARDTDIITISTAIDREMAAATAPESAPAPQTPSPHRS